MPPPGVFTRSLSRLSRKKTKRREGETAASGSASASVPPVPVPPPPAQDVMQLSSSTTTMPAQRKPGLLTRGMDRIRKSLRIRRDRGQNGELVRGAGAEPGGELWQPDENAVRAGLCSFNVKYLGSIEVFESRGMQVCEGALKLLRAQNRNPVKSVLYVSGDGLRLVDQRNQRGLILDQTIEKVSFCAPDRNNSKGFAYICREGTSRRWMCHGFHSTAESGERLSHAVGCAFAVCLEKKKKRDEEHTTALDKALNPNWDTTPSTSKESNFRRQLSISDRLQDPQTAIVNVPPQTASSSKLPPSSMAKPRPASNPALFDRQGSLRAPANTQQFFKRQYSLRDQPPAIYQSYGVTLHPEPIIEGDESVHDTSGDLSGTLTATPPLPSVAAAPATASWTAFQPPTVPMSPPAALELPQTASYPTENTADRWLQDALTHSLSLSSPEGAAPVSCPPPSHPPPPLPPSAILTSPDRPVGDSLFPDPFDVGWSRIALSQSSHFNQSLLL